ncbi:MAG: dihydrolipoyl dehydrogenase [Ignavibacteriae bacterium]|nr:dihydrolipoyl dehydrogenase [Ignavibacteriota bacterium]MCB9242160.1 dihydrolipoyl dehydrogenase [Ignavibacteriales bacterium]
MSKREIVVIGAGPGGYAAAFLAADLGMKVTLLDKEENPGGVCLYRGCIPSKALLHIAKVIREASEMKDWGVDFNKPKITPKKLTAWKDEVVNKNTGGLGILVKQRKIEYIRGEAKFLDSHTLEVTKHDGGTEKVEFDKAILATGSRPVKIPNISIDNPNVLDSTSALNIEDVPGTMLVIGGGYIGLELGSVYAALGTEVTVIEMLPHILNGADRDLARQLETKMKKEVKEIKLNSKVIELKEGKKGLDVTMEDKDGKQTTETFDKVLVSVGRKPNSENLGLENTKVEVTEKGFVKVNNKMQTADEAIYAIGDVVGEPMLAHKASHEGRTAVEVIAGHKAAFEPSAIPAVVFTDPEVAWCGLTETEAKEKGIEVGIAKFPWAASGRAGTLGRTDGLTKLLVEPETERVLGVGIAGPGAGELIAEGVLAVEMAATLTDVKMSIHPHPTLSETVMEAAEVFFGESTHFYKPKKK